MPKEVERSARRTAKKRGYGKKRTDAYVYGTLRNTGWKPPRERKGKGKRR